jgi:hypothetical protein
MIIMIIVIRPKHRDDHDCQNQNHQCREPSLLGFHLLLLLNSSFFAQFFADENTFREEFRQRL